jgi:hypothetical protein
MATVNLRKRESRFDAALHCNECGNNDLFVEIMSHESHLIDGKLDYLHLLDSDVDHYLCHLCGNTVELVTSKQVQ